MKRSVTIRGAWITGIFALIAAMIAAAAHLYVSSGQGTSVSATSSGKNSASLAIGGNVRDSTFIFEEEQRSSVEGFNDRITSLEEVLASSSARIISRQRAFDELYAILRGSSIKPEIQKTLNKWDLSGLNLNGLNLSGLDLSGTNLNKTDLSGANLQKAILSRVNAWETSFEDASLDRATLSGQFVGSVFRNATLRKVKLGESESNRTWFVGVDFGNSVLVEISAANILVTGGSFDGSNLSRAQFKESIFIASNWKLSATNSPFNLSADDADRLRNYEPIQGGFPSFSGANFSGADLKGWEQFVYPVPGGHAGNLQDLIDVFQSDIIIDDQTVPPSWIADIEGAWAAILSACAERMALGR